MLLLCAGPLSSAAIAGDKHLRFACIWFGETSLDDSLCHLRPPPSPHFLHYVIPRPVPDFLCFSLYFWLCIRPPRPPPRDLVRPVQLPLNAAFALGYSSRLPSTVIALSSASCRLRSRAPISIGHMVCLFPTSLAHLPLLVCLARIVHSSLNYCIGSYTQGHVGIQSARHASRSEGLLSKIFVVQ